MSSPPTRNARFCWLMVMETIPFAAPAGGAALRTLRSRTRSNSRSPCPSSSPLPVRRHLPLPCCRLLLNGVGRRWGTSSLFPLRFRPRLLHGGSFAVCQAHGDHGHHHDEQIHDGHRGHHQHRYQDQHHHHHHHHHHEGAAGERTAAEQAVMQFATAVGWVRLADFLREHLQLCCCSMVLLLAAATSPYLLPRPAVKPFQDATILLAFPLVGISSALDAVLNISAGRVNIHVLMALAAFASVFMGNALEGGFLLAMFNLAHIAEEYFTSRSMIDVRELKDNHPEFALVLETNGDVHPQFSELKYTKIPVRDIKVGSYLLVRAGESTKAWKDSTLSKIMQLTEEGRLNKPKLQRWLDEFGERYSKVVVALSVAVALLGPFLFKWPFIGTSVNRGSIYRALGLMVAASPCALAVAPLAYATAISACASKGILLKGGHVLDALASCQTIAFDKTGTLTTGKLVCKAIEPIHGHSMLENSSRLTVCCTPNCENEALAVAAAMEKGTTHPIGRAVVNHSHGKDLPIVSVESFECLPGRGLFATLTGIKVTLFHFEDEPREGVLDVVSTLRNQGKLRVMMLTGDHESSAWQLAKAVGIDEVYWNLKPEDKLNQVKHISRDTGGGLIMVGDGINDAPALAVATVGIVLAQRASATAIAVADVLLLEDNISSVPFCVAKARQTASLVKQSVGLALSCIILASLPSVMGFLPLWLTVLLHEGGTLLVCLNSIRALNAPTWSWRHDLREMLEGLGRHVNSVLQRGPPPGTVQSVTS